MDLQKQLTLASEAFQSGRFSQARELLLALVQKKNACSKVYELLGYASGNLGDTDAAFAYLKTACSHIDCSPEALYYLGKCYLQRREFRDAIFCYRSSIQKSGPFFEVLHDLGVALSLAGDYENASISFDEAARFNSESPELFFNKGLLCEEMGSSEKAIKNYDSALALNQGYVEAWVNRGNCLSDLNRYDDAVASYERAIKLKQDYAYAWGNRGNALRSLGRLEEALISYDRSVDLNPESADVWGNRGNVLRDLKRYSDALSSYQRAADSESNTGFWLGDLIHTQMKLCCWSDLESRLQDLKSRVLARKRASVPFVLLGLLDDSNLQKRCAEIYADYLCDSVRVHPLIKPTPRKEKIRIGYFSADFYDHATMHLIAGVFDNHDKANFEIYGFSFGPQILDGMGMRARTAMDRFIDVTKYSDLQVAELSRELGVDIAVDLKGYTQDARSRIFAYRAAPIQINFLGYPGTMASKSIDYLVADETLVPESALGDYSEKIIYVPGSYQPNDCGRVISNQAFNRRILGLPDEGFVFCCFNNSWKILPEMFDCWMRLLGSVDGSVLWLFADNAVQISNLRKEASSRNVNPGRLFFAERTDHAEHLARYKFADLFLDTFPYNAHTTASDALWSGLPVLTLQGNSFAGRVAASLLKAVGLPELIANSVTEYESLAQKLAMNQSTLSSLKARLLTNRASADLFNTRLFTKNLENAYRSIVERHDAGLSPAHVQILQ